jgi:hypothetical protein
VCETIEAARRRVLCGKMHGQNYVPVAVDAIAPSSAADTFAVLPQHPEATIHTR